MAANQRTGLPGNAAQHMICLFLICIVCRKQEIKIFPPLQTGNLFGFYVSGRSRLYTAFPLNEVHNEEDYCADGTSENNRKDAEFEAAAA